MAVRIESRLEDGRITPPTGLELIVTDHCNISCRQCNHGNPVLPVWLADPDSVSRDLNILVKIYRPRFVKILGGETLLHPRLLDVVTAVRESGISDYLRLVTNGMLLHKTEDDLWRALDEIEVSRYQGAGLTDADLAEARVRAGALGTKLTVNDFPDFRDTFTSVRSEDPALVDRIFCACKIVNVWGIHTLYGGRIYRCPQSIYVSALAGVSLEEGIEITEGTDFRDILLAFLNGTKPLASCRYCVGTVGRKRSHCLVPRKEWRDDLETPAEDMIDYDLLARLLVEQDPIDDCKTPAPLGTRPAKRDPFRAFAAARRRIRLSSPRWPGVVVTGVVVS
jgi:hypothetical protein